MTSFALLTCLFAVQQLQVSPAPAVVGDQLVLRATVASSGAKGASPQNGQAAVAPVEGLELTLVLPDGSRQVVGATNELGRFDFTAEQAGLHAFSGMINGVRCVAPVVIAPARNRWLLALAGVPLGLILFWLNIRRLLATRRVRKASGEQV